MSMDRRTFLEMTATGLAAAGMMSVASNAGAETVSPERREKMLRVGMLSGWHVHAKGYARELKALQNVSIVAVYDEDTERGSAWAKELDVPFYPDLATFLGRTDMDAVVCDAPSNKHPEVMIAAAQAGKHIFTEKVMALTVKEAESIAEAVKKAGVKFCISYPQRTRAKFLFAKKAVEEKLLGEISLMRVRVAHNGVSGDWLPPHFKDPITCGGGAMIDLGAHPMYLTRWIMGRPVKIQSTFTYMTKLPIEDNAVCSVEFENGSVAVVETSFMSSCSPDMVELYGTEGTLFAGGPEDVIKYQTSKQEDKNEGWVVPKLSDDQPRPIVQWAKAILEDKPMPFGLEDGIQLSELMEYAYIAHREGRKVEIPERKPFV